MGCLLALFGNHLEKSHNELFEAGFMKITISKVNRFNKGSYLASDDLLKFFLLKINKHELLDLRIVNKGASEFKPKEIKGSSGMNNFLNSKESYYATHQSGSAFFVY